MADLKAAGRGAAPLLLRLALGAIFLVAGGMKLGLGDPARGWDTTVASVHNFGGALEHLGVPAPQQLAWVTALTEFLGGAFLILGFATPIACLGITAVMVVAILKVHGQNGFMGIPEANGTVHVGYAEHVLIIASALALALMGPGPLSLDSLFSGMRKKKGEEK